MQGATSWSWSFGDGSVSTQQNPTHTYLEDGLYDVRLTVTGPDGVSVEHKPGYIRVGEFARIALIGGLSSAIEPWLVDGRADEHWDPAVRGVDTGCSPGAPPQG